MPNQEEASKIEAEASKPVTEANEQARKAWRGWLIPAVGSMAFFSSMLINGINNYKTYGFPMHVFSRTDKLMFALPVVVVVLALTDTGVPHDD